MSIDKKTLEEFLHKAYSKLLEDQRCRESGFIPIKYPKVSVMHPGSVEAIKEVLHAESVKVEDYLLDRRIYHIKLYVNRSTYRGLADLHDMLYEKVKSVMPMGVLFDIQSVEATDFKYSPDMLEVQARIVIPDHSERISDKAERIAFANARQPEFSSARFEQARKEFEIQYGPINGCQTGRFRTDSPNISNSPRVDPLSVLKKEMDYLKAKIEIGLGVPKALLENNPRPGLEIDKHGNPHKPEGIVPQTVPNPFTECVEDTEELIAKAKEAVDMPILVVSQKTNKNRDATTPVTIAEAYGRAKELADLYYHHLNKVEPQEMPIMKILEDNTVKGHPEDRDNGDICPSCYFLQVSKTPVKLPYKTVALIKEGKIDCPECGWKHGRCRAGLQQGRKPCNELLVSSYVYQAGQKERYHCPKCSQTYDAHFNMLK